MTNTLVLPGKVSRTELALPKNMTEPEWQEVGNQLRQAGGSIMWWLGDWWAYGEEHEYGSRKAFVDSWENGYSFQTCVQAGSVSRAVTSNIRILVVPWSYHRCVVKLEPAQQKRALAWAEKNIKEKINLADFKFYIKKYILKEGDEGDNDDEEAGNEGNQKDKKTKKEPKEETNYKNLVFIARRIVADAKQVKASTLKKERLNDALRTAKRVAAAWNSVIKDLEKRLQGARDG